MVGHSVGGQIIGLTPNNPRIAGMFAVAAQSGNWRNWPGLRKLWILAVWYVYVPLPTRLWGYFPGSKIGMGEDLPVGIALDWARGMMAEPRSSVKFTNLFPDDAGW